MGPLIKRLKQLAKLFDNFFDRISLRKRNILQKRFSLFMMGPDKYGRKSRDYVPFGYNQLRFLIFREIGDWLDFTFCTGFAGVHQRGPTSTEFGLEIRAEYSGRLNF